MKQMRKKMFMMLALVAATLTGAAADKAYISDFSIKAGETKLVAVNLDSEHTDLVWVKGTVTMPAGLTVENQGTADAQLWMTPDKDRTNGGIAQYAPGSGEMAVVSLTKTFDAGSGPIGYLLVKAAIDMPKTCTITLSGFTGMTEADTPVSIDSEDCAVTRDGSIVEFAFSPATLTMTAGEQAEVEVLMTNAIEVSGLQAVLSASEGLTISGVTQGDRLSDWNYNAATGRIIMLGDIEGNEGTVFTVTLTANEGYVGNATLTATKLVVTNTGAKALAADDITLDVTVQSPPDVTLDEAGDNSEALEQLDGHKANVTLTRTLTTGGWNTFAVPFSLTISEAEAMGITAVKELSSSTFSDGQLDMTFADATAIEAGKPYLVTVGKDLVNPVFSNVTVSKSAVKTETGAVDFVPTLGKTLVTGTAGHEGDAASVLMLGADDKLVRPSVVNDPDRQASYMKGFRAYFQLKGDAAGARSFSIDLGGATGLKAIGNGQQAIDDADSDIYDLSGRKVTDGTQRKGVYIVNGKKLIIK